MEKIAMLIGKLGDCYGAMSTNCEGINAAGPDIEAVKDVPGHGSIKSTEVYAKVALEKKIEAVCLFNVVFGKD